MFWPLLAHKELSSYPDAERCYDRSDNRDKEDFGREVFLAQRSSQQITEKHKRWRPTTADKTFAVLKRTGGMCIMPATNGTTARNGPRNRPMKTL